MCKSPRAQTSCLLKWYDWTGPNTPTPVPTFLDGRTGAVGNVMWGSVMFYILGLRLCLRTMYVYDVCKFQELHESDLDES